MNMFLDAFRVVDLTDHRGSLAGHMLAQLGADVVQVEPPAGTDARRAAPLTDDGQSMYWQAYGSGKRSVVCDYSAPEGKKTLEDLIRQADVLIESSSPGEMKSVGLDYAAVAKLNPSIIYLSITGFGQSGPKAEYADTDLIVWASSGYLLLSRDGEKAPVRFSVPQAYLHAAADGVSGVLIALLGRLQSGVGQHVDVSAQQSAALATLATSLAAKVGHDHFSVPGSIAPPKPGEKKQLDLSGSGSRTKRPKWDLQDGLAEMHLAIGPAAGRFANNMIAWIAEEGDIDSDIAQWDWTALPEKIHADEVTDDDLERARDQVGQFLRQFRKSDLVQQAIRRKLLLAPIMNTADLLDSPHHKARGFFQTLETSDGKTIQLPGDFALSGDSGFKPLTPAPALGEHTDEVLQDWLKQKRQVPASPLAQVGPAPNNQPLSHLKVLDLAWVVAGPIIGRTLADYGAQVIRVESSKRIETARMMGPFPDGKPDPQKSALFENCNAGKLGLTLNITTEEGKQIIRELVAWADVVVESFSPGQMATWGLGYDALKKINPSIIMLSTSLMGQSGPYSHFSGFGNVGAAVSGFQGIVGWPGEQPIGPFGPYSDFVGPRFATAALLAVLLDDSRSDKGCWLDVSQAEAGIQFLAPYIAHYSATGEVPQLQGNRDVQYSPSGVFSCIPDEHEAESWVAIAARTDEEWRTLAKLIGGIELADAPRFATLNARKENEDALETLLNQWTSSRSAHEVETTLQQYGIPAHKLLSATDMACDAHLQSRGHYLSLPHPLMEHTVVESSRTLLSGTPGNPSISAPTFGRDNEKILRDILGYEDTKIKELTTSGILS